jgi:5-methylcytosine-specific restriction endonuclease McrA
MLQYKKPKEYSDEECIRMVAISCVYQDDRIKIAYNLSESGVQSCLRRGRTRLFDKYVDSSFRQTDIYRWLRRKPCPVLPDIHKDHPYEKKLKSYTRSHPTFTVQDIIDKYGEKPVCYLTGKEIDIYKDEFSFDHFIPRSKGGESDLENMRIVLTAANKAKSNLDFNVFLEVCRLVAKEHPE